METVSLSQLAQTITETPEINSTVLNAYTALCDKIRIPLENQINAYFWNYYAISQDSDMLKNIRHDILVKIFDDLRAKKFNYVLYKADKGLLSGILCWYTEKAKYFLFKEFKREEKFITASRLHIFKDEDDNDHTIEEKWVDDGYNPEEELLNSEWKQKAEKVLGAIENKKYRTIMRAVYRFGKHLPDRVKQKIMEDFGIKTDEDFATAKSRAGKEMRKAFDKFYKRC